jgi:hypothetical protein
VRASGLEVFSQGREGDAGSRVPRPLSDCNNKGNGKHDDGTNDDDSSHGDSWRHIRPSLCCDRCDPRYRVLEIAGFLRALSLRRWRESNPGRLSPRPLAAFALLLLAGCSTCRDHGTACAIAAGVAASCIALSLDHNSSRTHDVATPAVVCDGGACR